MANVKTRALVVAALAAGALTFPSQVTSHAAGADAIYDGPITDLPCDAGSLPETEQGRVSAADITSGRAAKGYTCNASQVSHITNSGGFRVEKYTDLAGHTCAFYDSTLLFPRDVATEGEGPGTFVVDMTDSANPVVTDTLKTPAMLSPHESLRVNAARGLLAADDGNPFTSVGFVDVYDVSKDCRTPTLDSSTPLGIFGHESGFSPDGKTFYDSSPSTNTLVAIDLTDPTLPSILWASGSYSPHGMSLSDDGNRLYIASLAQGSPGLLILDVSQIQARTASPVVTQVSALTWPDVSIPQIARPMQIDGHKYLMENDEYNSNIEDTTNAANKVGAARIINIDDEKNPFVVSNIRLAVDQMANRAGDQANDPGAESPVQGYAAHYCSIPTEVNPTIMACSMILSGLRIFDIRDPAHPVEIAYFNGPVVPGVTVYHEGSFAMSSPSYDLAKKEVWYSDGNSGFYVVKLTGAAAAVLPDVVTPAAPAAPAVPAAPAAPVAAAPVAAVPAAVVAAATPAGTASTAPVLAHTGLETGVPLAAVVLLGTAFVVRRRRTADRADLPTLR